MLLDFPAKLGNILPAAGASCFVQLLEIALALFALRVVLCRCKLSLHAMTLFKSQ
jgi:hypothetical protein